MEDNELLNPLDKYNKELKDNENTNAEKYFDDLVTKSKVDVEANRETVRRYKKYLALTNKKSSQVHSLKALKVLSIVFASIFGVLFVIFLICAIGNDSNVLVFSLLSVLFALLAVALILVLCLVINKKLKNSENELAELQAKVNALHNEALAQMAPLNALYDWNMQTEVMNKTTPLIQMDKYFDLTKLDLLSNRFNYEENESEKSSVYYIQSGSINGNPFVFERDFDQSMGTKTYTGSITISWTVTVHDSEGRSHTETRTQVLTASVSKPIPIYNYHSYLFYGNDAAPDLSFKRSSTGISSAVSERDIQKMVKKKSKDIQKFARKEAMGDVDGNGSMFTEMTNSEFDALFGAIDRDNEVQFRLLFTPLAQQSMINLIKHSPYGDDFSFVKTKKLNCIRAGHLENLNLYGNPEMFIDFDIDAAKAKFITYNNDYFKGVYFTMAPLLTIPLYQQNKPFEFIYKRSYDTNYTDSEEEVMANSFTSDVFVPTNAKTNTIVKTRFVKKNKSFDEVIVTGHAFSATKKVENVTVLGGDGRMHIVPVVYFEYNPIYKETLMEVKRVGASRSDYNSSVSTSEVGSIISKYASSHFVSYQRGMLAFVPIKSFSEVDATSIETILGDKYVSSSIKDKAADLDKMVDDLKIK